MKSDDAALEELLGGRQSDPFDWREYYHAIRERLWIVILCVIVAAIGAAVYLNRQETKFRARAVLFIEQEKDRILKGVEGVREEQVRSLDMINTMVDLLNSYPFAQRVAERTSLHKDNRFLAGVKAEDRDKMSPGGAAGVLMGSVSSKYRENTRLIDVVATLSDPSLATDVANAYVDEYIHYGFEKQTEANKAASQYLLEEAEGLRKKMRVADEAMQSFRERERAASLENMQESTQSKLTNLTGQMAELETRISQLDNDLATARANEGNVDELLRLPSVAAETKVAQLNQAVADAQRGFSLITERYRAKHPMYIAGKSQLESLLAERAKVMRDVVKLLDAGRQRLQAQYDELKRTKDEQETRLLGVTSKSVEYNDLKRELETNRAMYDSVLARMKEIDITKGLTDSPVRVHERAQGAGRIAVSPSKTLATALFAGLAAGIGIALGLHMLDHSIKTVEQAEKVTGLPVLAAVPKKRHGKVRELDVLTDRDGIVAESFRSLRTSLAMQVNAEERRVFLFTSALPSEGKTFCSSNFAVTLCQQGYRTLLIDADLRKPMIARVFFGESKRPGLSEHLAGQAKLEEVIFQTKVENLDIIPAGDRVPNPAELLAKPPMRELLAFALASYDRVVVDTAPVLAVSDVLLIAPHVDVTCLVIRSFRTPKKMLMRAVKALDDVKSRPAGLVLNFLKTGAGSYYYYYSGQQYGGTEVYGAHHK